MKKLFAAVLLLTGISFWACQKEFSYETTNDVASTGAWEFKDSANNTYAGNPQAYTIDTTNASALMDYTGITANQRGLLSISIIFPTRVPATGTYSSLLGQVDFSYSVGSSVLFRAESISQIANENITVVISQITDTSVTGTFSGTALDSLNKVRIVKEGKFTYKKRAAATTPTNPVSAGSLGTSTDSCTGAIVSGTYKKAVAMAGTNTVTITANVTTVGTYTIYSDTLKGIYFRGTGTFATTGAQSVVVPALGTPTDSGTVRFRIRYGTSSCTFRVKIDTGSAVVIVPPTTDTSYLPTTTNSNWGYDIYNGVGAYVDSLHIRSTGTTRNIGSDPFNILLDSYGDTTLYRKASGTYYEGIDLDDLFVGGGVRQGRILIESTAVNGTWTDNYSLTLGGVPFSGVGTYKITGKPASAIITTTTGAVTYSNVIQVNAVYTLTSTAFPGLPSTTIRTRDTWYAKGRGIIYQKNIEHISADTAELRLRRSQIF